MLNFHCVSYFAIEKFEKAELALKAQYDEALN